MSKLVAQTGELKACLPYPVINVDESDDDEDHWDIVKASDIIVTTYDALDKACCARILQTVRWGRVVLDEMQEIRSSTTKIAKNCEQLHCDRRWMLSGTPIFGGIEDLKGELNFLRLEPFGASWEDGFFDFAIKAPWESKQPHAVAVLQILCLVALRRSKDMTIAESGIGLLDLKPMTVEYIPVPQTHSERALYCWMEYLVACELELTAEAKIKKQRVTGRQVAAAEKANIKNRAQCLRLLREICITPMLINGGLGATSQLRAIDALMTAHNERSTFQNHTTRVNGDLVTITGRRIMSCNQALQFLTQHKEAARTDADMVTTAVVGGGRGVTNRDRAVESPEQRFSSAEVDVESATKALKELSKQRAKARWHLALEHVTSGRYSDGRVHQFSCLWAWRRLVNDMLTKRSQSLALPTLLTRGWRPSKSLKTDLYTPVSYTHLTLPTKA